MNDEYRDLGLGEDELGAVRHDLGDLFLLGSHGHRAVSARRFALSCSSADTYGGLLTTTSALGTSVWARCIII